MVGILRYHDEKCSLYRLNSQLRWFRGAGKTSSDNKCHGDLLNEPQPLDRWIPEQGKRCPMPHHVETFIPGHAPKGLHLRVEGEVARLGHMDLQIHQHIPLLGRRTDGKLITKVLSRSLRGLLIARIGGQDAYEEIRRIVSLRAVVAMIGKETQGAFDRL